jgi:hypothetical protein
MPGRLDGTSGNGPLQAKLTVLAGDEQASQFELRLPSTIGRSRSTDITLGHPLVSRRHCELLEIDGQIMVRDLNSMNGTYIGDVRVGQEPVPLPPGKPLVVANVPLRIDYVVEPEQTADEQPTESATLEAPLMLAKGDSRRFDAQHAHRPSGLHFERPAD